MRDRSLFPDTRIIFVVAAAQNGVIGNNGDLPWHLPDDFKHFKKVTLGHTVVMGHSTFKSLGNKPLANRTNVILSRKPPSSGSENEVWLTTIEEVNIYASEHHLAHLMILGGANIFEQFQPYADEILLTLVEADVAGDTAISLPDREIWNWEPLSHHQVDERHAYPFTIYRCTRRSV